MKRMAEVMTKVLAGLIAAIGFAVSVHVPTACASTIVVGGKGFTEQLLLAEITAQLLKARGFKVDKRDGMGSQVVRDAQINGQVDVYWEYTGTSLVIYNKYKQAKGRLTAEDAYEKVKELDAKRGLTWLKPSAANNTFALAVRASDARTDGLKTLSDLARAYNDKKGLIMAVGAEFPWRSDLKAMDPGLTYLALKKDLVDAAVVFATDGRIEAFNFRILADDKGFFQNYALVPVIRTETLEANPKLAEPLNALSAKLNDAVMRRLNAEVDVQHKPIKAVAAAFLKSVGLI
jgi:osmoprotectant transport system substrate-binding protein